MKKYSSKLICPPLFFSSWLSGEDFSDLFRELGELDVMKELNYPGWNDVYKSIDDFTKGRLPAKGAKDICWVIEESKYSVFQNKILNEKKKTFSCVMYIYAANWLAMQGEHHDGEGFLEYCHYRLLHCRDCDFVLNFLKWILELLKSKIDDKCSILPQVLINYISLVLSSALKKEAFRGYLNELMGIAKNNVRFFCEYDFCHPCRWDAAYLFKDSWLDFCEGNDFKLLNREEYDDIRMAIISG